MPTSYPGGLDNFTNPTASDQLDSATVPHASQHANLNDAVEAIEGELGTNPKGAKATVKARLDDVDTAISGKVSTSVSISTTAPLAGGGDLSANRTLSIADATTLVKGAVQLIDSVSSISTTTAATPNSVKSAYDAAIASVQTSRTISTTAPLTGGGDLSANRTLTIADATTSIKGAVQLTDSVSSTSTTTAATPNAVKTAYDLALVKNPTLKKVSGIYYRSPMNSRGNTTPIHQRVYYTPIYVESTTSFDRLAFQTGSGFAGTATVRMGIFNDSNGYPSTVVVDAGTVTATALTTVYEITISQTLAPGFYWLAFCQQGTAPTTPQYLGVSSGDATSQNYYIGGSTVPSSACVSGAIQSNVTGAFGTAASLTYGTLTIWTFIRAA